MAKQTLLQRADGVLNKLAEATDPRRFEKTGNMGRATDQLVLAYTETGLPNTAFFRPEDQPEAMVIFVDPAKHNLFAIGYDMPARIRYMGDYWELDGSIGTDAGTYFGDSETGMPDGMSIWYLAAGSGTTATVYNGEQVTFATSASISASISGRTITHAIVAPVTVPNGGTGADLSSLTTGAVVVKNSTATLTAANWTAKSLIIGAGTGAPTFLAPGTNRFVAISNGTDWQSRALVTADLPAGTGTVTSVGLSTNSSFLTVGSSPITTTGTITLNLTTGLTANQVLATPNGSTGTVSLRALVDADIPDALTINGGTITASPISGSTGSFTTLAASSTVTFSPDANTTDTFAGVGITTFKHQSNTAGQAPTVNLYRTRASNAAVQTNDVLGIIQFQSMGDVQQARANIYAYATENHDASLGGTNLVFQVTRAGSETVGTIIEVSGTSVTVSETLTVNDAIVVNPNSSTQIASSSVGLEVIHSSSDTVSPAVNIFKSRGSIASKSAVNSGDFIGTVNFQSFGDQQQTRVQILTTATEAHSSTAGGADMKIYVTPNTTETLALAATFGQDLSLRVEGDFTADGDLHTFGDGSSSVGLNLFPSNTGDAGIQIGNGRGGDGLAYIDFVAATTANYDARLIRLAGANAEFQMLQRGTSALRVRTEGAADISLDTNATQRMSIASGGTVDIVNLLVSGGVRVDADPGGAASTVTFTNVTLATGGATPATPGTVSRWIKIFDGTTARYIPAYV